eukprot:358851-Chlamydomonas_euryale.AAC.5
MTKNVRGALAPDVASSPPGAALFPPGAASSPPDAALSPLGAALSPPDAALSPPDAALFPPDAALPPLFEASRTCSKILRGGELNGLEVQDVERSTGGCRCQVTGWEIQQELQSSNDSTRSSTSLQGAK